jgi:hypothetical protein
MGLLLEAPGIVTGLARQVRWSKTVPRKTEAATVEDIMWRET